MSVRLSARAWPWAVGLSAVLHGAALGALWLVMLAGRCAAPVVAEVKASPKAPPMRVRYMGVEKPAPANQLPHDEERVAKRAAVKQAVLAERIDLPPPGDAPSAEPAATPVEAAGEPTSAAPVAAPPSTDEVVPFGPGMTPPKCDQSRAPIEFTEQALDARVNGTMVLRCHVMVDGSVRNCRVVKPLPFMSEVALAAAARWVCAPATFEGKPVNVDVSMPIQLVSER